MPVSIARAEMKEWLILEEDIPSEQEIPAEQVQLKEKREFLFKNPHARCWCDEHLYKKLHAKVCF